MKINDADKRLKKLEGRLPSGEPLYTQVTLRGIVPAWVQMNIPCSQYFEEAQRRGIKRNGDEPWPVFDL